MTRPPPATETHGPLRCRNHSGSSSASPERSPGRRRSKQTINSPRPQATRLGYLGDIDARRVASRPATLGRTWIQVGLQSAAVEADSWSTKEAAIFSIAGQQRRSRRDYTFSRRVSAPQVVDGLVRGRVTPGARIHLRDPADHELSQVVISSGSLPRRPGGRVPVLLTRRDTPDGACRSCRCTCRRTTATGDGDRDVGVAARPGLSGVRDRHGGQQHPSTSPCGARWRISGPGTQTRSGSTIAGLTGLSPGC
jgi:hypothetical protein